jgi:hypothetical protein
MGSAGPGAASPVVGRSVEAVLAAEAFALTFMSAMLTYFVFMLQKPFYGRNDRTETVLFRQG